MSALLIAISSRVEFICRASRVSAFAYFPGERLSVTNFSPPLTVVPAIQSIGWRPPAPRMALACAIEARSR
jgi:hypothetical protein